MSSDYHPEMICTQNGTNVRCYIQKSTFFGGMGSSRSRENNNKNSGGKLRKFVDEHEPTNG